MDAVEMPDVTPSTSRRELLTNLNPVRKSGKSDSPGSALPRTQPSAGSTIRLTTRAMACDFSVIMPPGPVQQIEVAGQVLDLVHDIESWLSIYREDSELSAVNRLAATEPVRVRHELFCLLDRAVRISQQTNGAFDMASGSLTRLWRACRQQQRVPSEAEVQETVARCGLRHLTLLDESQSVKLARPGVVLDPGAIGKGFALDEGCRWLTQHQDAPQSFLLHGGHSSLLARGPHNGHSGWPVGIGNPLFTEKRLGTLLLCNQAMATSGSNIQFYRHEGKRYGHILDPQTGWPVEGMLSVTVLASSAALADALSTAFFVMGVEKATHFCENCPEVGAILLPFPDRGTRVQPRIVGVSPELIVWDEDQVDVAQVRSGRLQESPAL